MLQQLKKAYVERVVNSGFEDSKLYNDELLKLDDIELEEFNKLKGIIGQTKAIEKTKAIDINKEGFTEEEYEELEKIKKKPKKELTEEEKKRLEELKEQRKQKSNAISILRGISIRIPLLVYGADVPLTKDITIEEFPDLVDDLSWEEFMPKDVTKEIFRKFSKYYDKDVFVASTYRIRALAKSADDYEPTERIKKIAQIFSTFRNPDKETVLTPWSVVNMHMSDTIGGYDFFDEEHKAEIEVPRYVNQEDITNRIFNDEGKVLEINSKTGLYPLYIAYTFYRFKLENKELTLEERMNIWDEVVKDNLFVICKTPMAKQITKRTLLGYRNGKINAHAFDDLINQLKLKQQQFVDKVTSCNFWNKEGNKMKFNAVVGNPPYQEVIDNRSEQPPVYHLFWDGVILLSDISTLITPARFLFNAGKTPEEWNKKMLNSSNFQVTKCYMNSSDVFPAVDIKGGVAICLYNKTVEVKPIRKFFNNSTLKEIYGKVQKNTNSFIDEILTANTSYKYKKNFFQENPGFINRVSGGSKRYLSSSVFTKFPEVFLDKKPNENYAAIIGLINGKRIIKYLKIDYINPPINFNHYKVILPASNGSGTLGEKLTNPMIGYPKMGATETFISLGCFDSISEAENLMKYLKTKFARLMLGVNKVTQGNKTKESWSAVPMQNFSNDESDIDWSLPINKIDEKLFAKYDLSDSEINWICTVVEEMK